MKTDLMDRLEHHLSRHHGKGPLSYVVYTGIFLFMLVYVLAKPLINLLTVNKMKLK